MREIDLRYGTGTVRVAFPAGGEVEVVRPRGAGAVPADGGRSALRAAMDAPVGARPLEEAARGARRVTVVVPDRTRPAATPLVLAEVLERLGRAGVADSGVTVLVGGGIHEPASAEEAAAIAGPAARRIAVRSTAPDDDAAHAALEPDPAVSPLFVHRFVAEADLVVLTGAVAPHYLAGFSGGAKGLVPGCASRETVLAAHRLTLDATVAPDGSVRPLFGRLQGNRFREALLRIARRFGKTWLVAVDVEPSEKECDAVVAAHAGEVGDAHEAAARDLVARRAVPRPAPADLVVAAGGSPRDRDLVQAHKALALAAEVAKPGAPIVWLAHAGDGPGHPRFLPWFETGRLDRHLLSLRRGFHPYGLTAYALRWKASRHPVHVVSTMSRDVLRPMGLLPYDDPQRALDAALAAAPGKRVVVLEDPGATLFA